MLLRLERRGAGTESLRSSMDRNQLSSEAGGEEPEELGGQLTAGPEPQVAAWCQGAGCHMEKEEEAGRKP